MFQESNDIRYLKNLLLSSQDQLIMITTKYFTAISEFQGPAPGETDWQTASMSQILSSATIEVSVKCRKRPLSQRRWHKHQVTENKWSVTQEKKYIPQAKGAADTEAQNEGSVRVLQEIESGITGMWYWGRWTVSFI